MKIDELIEELEELQDRFGNIDLGIKPKVVDGEKLTPSPYIDDDQVLITVEKYHDHTIMVKPE